MRQEITDEIKVAFDTDLKDAVKDFIGIRRQISDDDWLMNGEGSTSQIKYGGRGVFTGYHAHEIDGNTILQNDVKLICLQSEIDRTPMLDDIINQMRVMALSADPAGVSWVIQLRGVS